MYEGGRGIINDHGRKDLFMKAASFVALCASEVRDGPQGWEHGHKGCCLHDGDTVSNINRRIGGGVKFYVKGIQMGRKEAPRVRIKICMLA